MITDYSTTGLWASVVAAELYQELGVDKQPSRVEAQQRRIGFSSRLVWAFNAHYKLIDNRGAQIGFITQWLPQLRRVRYFYQGRGIKRPFYFDTFTEHLKKGYRLVPLIYTAHDACEIPLRSCDLDGLLAAFYRP